MVADLPSQSLQVYSKETTQQPIEIQLDKIKDTKQREQMEKLFKELSEYVGVNSN